MSKEILIMGFSDVMADQSTGVFRVFCAVTSPRLQCKSGMVRQRSVH